MAELYTIDGAHVTLIRDGTVELTQIAEMGQEGMGTIGIDDTAGTLSVVGHKDVAVTQSSCANTRTYKGFVDDREYERGSERSPDVAAGRWITVQLVDLNNYLSQTGVVGTDAKRPAETAQERFDWLTGSNDWPSQVAIGSRIDIPAKGMDKAVYRQQQPADVLSDIATACGGLNYYVADWGSGPELTFRNDNTSTADSSAVRISNVLTDVDSGPETLGANKTFAPSVDFKLNRSPREVYSKMSLSYAKGTETDERTATATTFNGERYGTASNSHIKTASKAADALTDLLHIHSTERDFLEGSIIVPSSAVNLVRQGERMQVKFSHLNTEGYGSFTWCRIMERTVKPLTPDGAIYELRLRLSPQEAGPVTPTIVQSVSGFWGTGGSGLEPYTHFPNPVTIGNVLLIGISQRSSAAGHYAYPLPPNTETALPNWGTDPWTALFADTYVEVIASDDARHGIQWYWKIADSTSQDCAILNDYENLVAYELTGIDMGTAVLARANNQSAATNMDCGTLGTVATGELAFMLIHWVPDEPFPLPTVVPAAGWGSGADLYNGNYPYWGGSTRPIAWISHAFGAGAVINPAITHPSGRRWCGLALKVGP